MKMDDLIFRKTAIEALSTPCDKRYRHGVWETCLDNIETAIRNIPAVDAAPVVHARWIETTIPANTTGHGGVGQDKKKGWLCSNCKCAFDAMLLWCDSFCPNCGAKNVEE